MATLDELFTAQNQRLFDLLFRHQVYLEGWKTNLAAGYREFLNKLYAEFALYLRQTRYQSLDQFTKAQLTTFVYNFKEAQTKFYSQYTSDLIAVLQQFLRVDVAIHKQIIETVTAKTVTQAATPLKTTISEADYTDLDAAHHADYTRVGNRYKLTDAYFSNQNASGIYGIAAVTTDDISRLWANIIHAPIPANGLLLIPMIDDFGSYASKSVTSLVYKGYANAWSVTELTDKLLGTDRDFTNGLLGLLLAQHISLLNTAVQHISTEAQAAVSSVYFEQYQWVSILDNVTTQICRERDGNVYVYGVGPLPPAHWNCRSKAVPIVTGSHLHNIPTTYAAWLGTQPKSFVNDVSSTKSLTLDEFQGKVKDILGD